MNNQQVDIFSQLVSSKDFRDWVQHPNKERNHYWEKWMQANPEKIGDLKKAREFIERMTFKTDQLQAEELDNILLRIVSGESSCRYSEEQERVLSERHSGLLKIAATLVVFLIAVWTVKEIGIDNKREQTPVRTAWKTIENPKGKKSKVTLPDGSQVDLNYESSLRFPDVFEGGIRKVELIGEAFFDVKPHDDQPFIVVTGEIETIVLGTTFNIRSQLDDLETDVSLVTGKVQVNYSGRAEEIASFELSPGEQLSVDRQSKTIEKRPFDVQRVTAWKDGIILFRDAGFEEFIDQLERWYGVNFQIYGTAPNYWKVNGRYQNEKLEDILSGLSFVYDLEYKIQGRNVILSIK